MDRILVIATRQIGDVLLTTPLIAQARRRWPQAHIAVLGFAGTLGMLQGNPDVAELIETPPRLGWRGLRGLVRRLWRRYDLALVTQPSDRAHLLAWIASGTRSGLVPQRSGSNWWKKRLLLHAVPIAGDLGAEHVVTEKLRLLSPWALVDEEAPPRVAPPPAADLPADVARQLQPGFVVLHAPSMWPYKQWPVENFRALASALLARGRQVVLTGAAGPRDQACIAPLRDLAPPPQLLDVSGRLGFAQLSALLARAALYVGPDTSVSHLAAATGVPTIAIFGPTNPMRWAPWPAQARARALFERSTLVQHEGNVTVLQASFPCVPCGRAGCEDHNQSRSDCLPAITVERVLEQALAVLQEGAGSPPARG